jgi:hypothetical protein
MNVFYRHDQTRRLTIEFYIHIIFTALYIFYSAQQLATSTVAISNPASRQLLAYRCPHQYVYSSITASASGIAVLCRIMTD